MHLTHRTSTHRAWPSRSSQGPRPVLVATLAGLLVALLAGCGSDQAARTATATANEQAPGWAVSKIKGVSAQAGATPAAAASAGRRAGEWSGPVAQIRVGDASVVAAVTGRRIDVHVAADATSKKISLSNPLPSGGPLTFLVQENTSGWVRVLLPVRPNQSQGWVRASDVSLRRVDYRMTVSTRRHELTVYEKGRVVLRAPVGLGAGTTPTPGGVFYLKELLKPSNPKGAYGPYAFGLSGYSPVLYDFGGGQGELGIHGTNDPKSLGRSVSHGCIRVRNDVITKLAKLLPLGVPVQILA